jgi:predicted DCC family thiol-disulfide oxidoreductase YuxK
MATPQNNIVFFDGECGFCDTSIRKIMQIDRAKQIRYAPLQGTTAAERLPPEFRNKEALNTVVYLNPLNQRFAKSEAFFEILRNTGGPWKFLLVFRMLPLGFRDSIYDAIAKRRRSLISKDSCPNPTEDQRSRILP